jgi:predicted ABC-type ATPase
MLAIMGCVGEEQPRVVIIAGPNGSGKSTSAPLLLDTTFGVTEFVNADVIAQGLSAFKPESAAIAAGRIMLERLRNLAQSRDSFAFETTLASRSFAPWIAELTKGGYRFHLVYLWLPSAALAIERVAHRVLHGGHHVPGDVVRRRLGRGIGNFFSLYQPLATTWRAYDNSAVGAPRLIAQGQGVTQSRVADEEAWQSMKEMAT